ncbi:MAG: hypothetical protein IPJ81_07220 [Chitinophagaceae bacterium]|nr:hypothetical protein [Chitinophagaceae bacterium]
MIADEKTDLLIRARANRTLADNTKLFDCLSAQQAQGCYEIPVEVKEEQEKKGYNKNKV